METKCCSRCEKSLPFTEFYLRARSKDGLQTRCKPCCRELSAIWLEENPDLKRENNRSWYLKNQEERQTEMRKYQKERYKPVGQKIDKH